MTTNEYLASATNIGAEDAKTDRDMQPSLFFLPNTQAWHNYVAAYTANAPAKRVIAIGVSRNGQPFRVTVAGVQS